MRNAAMQINGPPARRAVLSFRRSGDLPALSKQARTSRISVKTSDAKTSAPHSRRMHKVLEDRSNHQRKIVEGEQVGDRQKLFMTIARSSAYATGWAFRMSVSLIRRSDIPRFQRIGDAPFFRSCRQEERKKAGTRSTGNFYLLLWTFCSVRFEFFLHIRQASAQARASKLVACPGHWRLFVAADLHSFFSSRYCWKCGNHVWTTKCSAQQSHRLNKRR